MFIDQGEKCLYSSVGAASAYFAPTELGEFVARIAINIPLLRS